MKNEKMGRREFMTRTAATAAVAGITMAGLAGAEAKASPKKALQLGMLPKDLPDAEKFKLAKECGFEGIEGSPMADLDAARKLGDLAKAAGTPIHSLSYGGWEAPMSSADPEVIKKGQQGIEVALRSAKAVGASVVLLVPAVVKGEVTEEIAYERSQKNIRPMLPLAEELGVILAVEVVWNNFLLNPASFARYVDDFKSPWLQAYFDTGNVVKYGLPEEWIRTLGKRIVAMHLKDFKRQGEKWTNLRDGDVNWPEVRRAMEEIGYTGYLTPELDGGDEAYLRDLSGRIDRILAGK